MRLLNHIKTGKVIRLVNQDKQRLVIMEDKHYRWLIFDAIIQSVMLKRAPNRLLMPHQQALLMPLLFTKPSRIIELGLGGGNFTRTVKALSPHSQLITAENDKDVIRAFDDYFNPEAIRFDIRHQTGEQLLVEQHNKFDWVVCDIYDHDNHHFMEQIKQSLLTQQSPTYWTINLPDMPEKKLNKLLEELRLITLQVLETMRMNYQVNYLEIPRFKNVIIYILPLPLARLLPEECLLPPHYARRLTDAWQHAIQVDPFQPSLASE